MNSIETPLGSAPGSFGLQNEAHPDELNETHPDVHNKGPAVRSPGCSAGIKHSHHPFLYFLLLLHLLFQAWVKFASSASTAFGSYRMEWCPHGDETKGAEVPLGKPVQN